MGRVDCEFCSIGRFNSYLGPDVRHDAWLAGAFLRRLAFAHSNSDTRRMKKSSKANTYLNRYSASRKNQRRLMKEEDDWRRGKKEREARGRERGLGVRLKNGSRVPLLASGRNARHTVTPADSNTIYGTKLPVTLQLYDAFYRLFLHRTNLCRRRQTQNRTWCDAH